MAYFYLIKNKKYNKYYAGSRSKEDDTNDLLSRYFTSSITVQRIIFEEGLDNWDIIDVKYFDTYEEAVSYEDKYLREIENKNEYFNINFSAGGSVIKSKTSIFITDGLGLYMRHDKDLPIPEGWHKEAPFSPPNRKGYKKCLNIQTGEFYSFHKDKIPEGWVIYSHAEFLKNLKSEIPRKNIWVTNGYDSKKISNLSDLEPGWNFGRTIKATKKRNGSRSPSLSKGRICITDGESNMFIYKSEEIPEGWSLGITRKSSNNKGKVWWNNGISETKSKECPGEGWVRGRSDSTKETLKISNNQKKKNG